MLLPQKLVSSLKSAIYHNANFIIVMAKSSGTSNDKVGIMKTLCFELCMFRGPVFT